MSSSESLFQLWNKPRSELRTCTLKKKKRKREMSEIKVQNEKLDIPSESSTAPVSSPEW